ncbi:MAG: hypothetical protein LAT76_12640 [Schleiferiaceae bacterium]|nr:hypothetical protein [Schleiferiaceae bacterium]
MKKSLLIVVTIGLLSAIPNTIFGQDTNNGATSSLFSKKEGKTPNTFGVRATAFSPGIIPVVVPKLSLDFSVVHNFELTMDFIIAGEEFLFPFWGCRYVGDGIGKTAIRPYFGLSFGGANEERIYFSQLGIRRTFSKGFELQVGLVGLHAMEEFGPSIGLLEFGLGWRF